MMGASPVGRGEDDSLGSELAGDRLLNNSFVPDVVRGLDNRPAD